MVSEWIPDILGSCSKNSVTIATFSNKLRPWQAVTEQTVLSVLCTLQAATECNEKHRYGTTFRGTHRIHLQFETRQKVFPPKYCTFYQTAWRHDPEDYDKDIHSHWNLKVHIKQSQVVFNWFSLIPTITFVLPVRLLLHPHSIQCAAKVSSVFTGWTTTESGSIPGRGKRFSLFNSFQPLSESHQLSYRIRIGILSRRIKRPRQA